MSLKRQFQRISVKTSRRWKRRPWRYRGRLRHEVDWRKDFPD